MTNPPAIAINNSPAAVTDNSPSTVMDTSLSTLPFLPFFYTSLSSVMDTSLSSEMDTSYDTPAIYSSPAPSYSPIDPAINSDASPPSKIVNGGTLDSSDGGQDKQDEPDNIAEFSPNPANSPTHVHFAIDESQIILEHTDYFTARADAASSNSGYPPPRHATQINYMMLAIATTPATGTRQARHKRKAAARMRTTDLLFNPRHHRRPTSLHQHPYVSSTNRLM